MFNSNHSNDYHSAVTATSIANQQPEIIIKKHRTLEMLSTSKPVKQRTRNNGVICDVAIIGNGPYTAASAAYQRWVGIIKRCYAESNINYRTAGGVGMRVSKSWLNFQNFAKWYELQCKSLGVKHKNTLKVTKNPSSKVYGPSTCKLKEAHFANAKTWSFINPEGDNVEVDNLRAFCIENKHSYYAFRELGIGSKKEHLGWTNGK